MPSEEEMSTAPALHAQRAKFLPRTQFAPTLANDTLPPGMAKKTGDGHPGEWGGQRRPRRRLFIRVAIILGVLLLCTGLVLTFFQTGLANAVFASTSATVTVTPDSQPVQTTYTASAVTGTLDPTQPQIQARKLSATSSVASTAVPASGQGHTNATYAYGTVNACYYGSNIGDKETVPAGTVVTDTLAPLDSAGHTRTIKILGSMTVLRIVGGAGSCSNDVQAQYMYPGSAGNIREYTNPDGSVTTGFIGHVGDLQVANGIGNNFSGGQDASDYTYVQQSDIDQAMNNLASQSVPNAQPMVSKQLHANERLVGASTCQMQISTNHALNDHAASVTATRTSTCSSEAYDYTAALNLANQQVRIQARTKLGPSYGLQGTLQLTLQSAVPAQNGTTQLTFQARGTLVYQISAARKHSWQQALQRMSKDTAGTWLHGQPGVKRVTIALRGWNQQSLPASASNITIVIASPS